MRSIVHGLEVMKRELQSRMDIVTQDLYNIKTELFDYSRNRRRLNDEIAALRRELSEGHYRDDRQVAESLAQKQALAAGVSIERGADLLWALGSAELYRMLVVERGWSPKAYEQWLANTWINALLRQRDQGNREATDTASMGDGVRGNV